MHWGETRWVPSHPKHSSKVVKENWKKKGAIGGRGTGVYDSKKRKKKKRSVKREGRNYHIDRRRGKAMKKQAPPL